MAVRCHDIGLPTLKKNCCFAIVYKQQNACYLNIHKISNSTKISSTTKINSQQVRVNKNLLIV